MRMRKGIFIITRLCVLFNLSLTGENFKVRFIKVGTLGIGWEGRIWELKPIGNFKKELGIKVIEELRIFNLRRALPGIYQRFLNLGKELEKKEGIILPKGPFGNWD